MPRLTLDQSFYPSDGVKTQKAVSKRSVDMSSESTIHRRRFVGHLFGAAAAASLSMSGTRAPLPRSRCRMTGSRR